MFGDQTNSTHTAGSRSKDWTFPLPQASGSAAPVAIDWQGQQHVGSKATTFSPTSVAFAQQTQDPLQRGPESEDEVMKLLDDVEIRQSQLVHTKCLLKLRWLSNLE